MYSKATIATAGVTLIGVLLIPAATRAATAAMPSDFNGDGYVDLAVGVPGEALGTKREAGGVNVLYGSAVGLTPTGDQFWSQDSAGVKGTSVGSGPHRSGDRFGYALASGDFDSDGFADLAIGVPGDQGVNVLYGSAAGLTATGDQFWTLATLSLPAELVTYGAVLASGDFDADGYWDLAIHAVGSWNVEGDFGRVVIVRGGGGGLSTEGAVVLDRSMTGAIGFIEPAYWFGSSLAAGDLDGDGFADLAVGMHVDDDHDARADVGVFYGSADGLTADGNQSWTQAAIGYGGHYLDEFGRALAIGDFDADGFGDLAIGTPESDQVPVNPEEYGEVAVVYGSASGLTAPGSQLWDEDVPGIPSAGHVGERFGYALAAGDLDGDGAADLVIGVPGEGSSDAGAVVAIYGSDAGLSATGSQMWTQDSAGVPGSREGSDAFGATVATADYGRSGQDDLAIGVPGEDLGGRSNAGVVNVLYGRSSGLGATGAQSWSQGTAGVKESVGAGDAFGSRLTP